MCHCGMKWGGLGRNIQRKLRYGNNTPPEVNKKSSWCSPERMSEQCCHKVKHVGWKTDTNAWEWTSPWTERHSLPLCSPNRLFPVWMWHCWTIHLSLCSWVLGNKEGSDWTAANTFIHSGRCSHSTSSPGVSHTDSLPVSTRGLGSCFLPYMAAELLWLRFVSVSRWQS